MANECMRLVRSHLQDVKPKDGTNGLCNWYARHSSAWESARGPELAIRRMIEAAAMYADAHAKRYQAPIGDDGVIGDYWLGMMRQIRHLLDGETGELSCGEVCLLLTAIETAAGFTQEEIDANG